MTIPWIRCSDRMPPDAIRVIMQFPEGNYNCVFGHKLETEVNTFGKELYSWIPYDEATWKELHR